MAKQHHGIFGDNEVICLRCFLRDLLKHLAQKLAEAVRRREKLLDVLVYEHDVRFCVLVYALNYVKVLEIVALLFRLSNAPLVEFQTQVQLHLRVPYLRVPQLHQCKLKVRTSDVQVYDGETRSDILIDHLRANCFSVVYHQLVVQHGDLLVRVCQRLLLYNLRYLELVPEMGKTLHVHARFRLVIERQHQR